MPFGFEGLSLHKLKDLLQDLGVKVSHVAIWKWVQKIGKKLKEKAFQKRKRKVLIADETKIRIKKAGSGFLQAINSENREIVNIFVTEHYELMDCPDLLEEMPQVLQEQAVLVTDGGPWYLRANSGA